jgi:hypothetical protein
MARNLGFISTAVSKTAGSFWGKSTKGSLSAKIDAGGKAAQTAEQKIIAARQGLTQLQATSEKYQLRPEHWKKLSRAEQKFDQSLKRIDKIFPEKYRGIGKEAEKTIGVMALLAALGLIGSTALVYVLANRNSD